MPPNMFVTCFNAILDNRHDEHAASELSARGMPLGLMPQMSYEENETVLVERASSSTATGWSRPTTLKERCSAFQGLKHSSPCTVKREHWGTA